MHESHPSNVWLVTVDCLRPDHLPAYGYKRPTAPFLSELATDGEVFSNAFATGPGTAISFPTILTSTHPFDYGGYHGLGDERTPVARVLSDQGISTVGIHSNPYLAEVYGYDAGFNVFESLKTKTGDDSGSRSDLIKEMIKKRLDSESLIYRSLQKVNRLFSGYSVPYARADEITDTAIEALDGRGNGSFFLWTHYMDVHSPLAPPEKFFKRFGDDPPDDWRTIAEFRGHVDVETDIDAVITAYDAAIRNVDEQIARLYNALEERDQHSETLIMVAADHGELLGEHGFVGHTEQLYTELLRVPLILYDPTTGASGSRRELVSTLDIAPTILRALDVDEPELWRGRPLHRFREPNANGYECVFAEICHDAPWTEPDTGNYTPEKALVTSISGDYKYTLNRRKSTELYRELVDWSEVPVSQEQIPNGIESLLPSAVEDHLSDVRASETRSYSEAGISDDMKDRLSKLGYM